MKLSRSTAVTSLAAIPSFLLSKLSVKNLTRRTQMAGLTARMWQGKCLTHPKRSPGRSAPGSLTSNIGIESGAWMPSQSSRNYCEFITSTRLKGQR